MSHPFVPLEAKQLAYARVTQPPFYIRYPVAQVAQIYPLPVQVAHPCWQA